MHIPIPQSTYTLIYIHLNIASYNLPTTTFLYISFTPNLQKMTFEQLAPLPDLTFLKLPKVTTGLLNDNNTDVTDSQMTTMRRLCLFTSELSRLRKRSQAYKGFLIEYCFQFLGYVYMSVIWFRALYNTRGKIKRKPF